MNAGRSLANNNYWRAPIALLAPCPALLLSACEGVQSSLSPAGPVARALAETWWVMLIGASAIFALVVAIASYVLFRAVDKRRAIGANTLIAAGGVVLPVVVLTVLLVYGMRIGERVDAAPAGALRLEVIGHQWWWEVRYPDYAGAVTANEIHVPVGRPVVVELQSADVIHSFWIPRLAGKTDVLPEQRNRLWFQADAAGAYRGQCAEFCGAQHARMALQVIAQPAVEFERWVESMRQPARRPATAAQARGREAFWRRECAACHTIRGTSAHASLGPDLTHVAGRRTLGALTLANTRDNLASWIRDSQAIKPDNRMPAFRNLEATELEDIVAYLESLE